MKRTRSFIFLFTLFTLAIVGCSKPKSPSGNGGGDTTFDNDSTAVVNCTDKPNYSGALGDDLRGKSNICPLIKDNIYLSINYYSSSEFISNKFYPNTPEYYEGVTIKDEFKIEYYSPNSLADGFYEGHKYCMVGYDKLSGERISNPYCKALSENNSEVFTFDTFISEKVFYVFIDGDSVETSTEYFVLPPLHKKA